MSTKQAIPPIEDLSTEALNLNNDEATGDSSLIPGKPATKATGAMPSVTSTGTIRVTG